MSEETKRAIDIYKILKFAEGKPSEIRGLEIREERIEKMIAMLDHAYNAGKIDGRTRDAAKENLEKRLNKIRKRIAERKLRS